MLKTADFVTLHVPELPSTKVFFLKKIKFQKKKKIFQYLKGLIGEKELALMKKGSYLLNYSRGTVKTKQSHLSSN